MRPDCFIAIDKEDIYMKDQLRMMIYNETRLDLYLTGSVKHVRMAATAGENVASFAVLFIFSGK